MKTIHMTVSGKVQGVWYRGWTVETATELGLNGWVRNRRDKTVEVLAHGPAEQVYQLIEKCWTGSPQARVDNVEVMEVDEKVDTGFVQLGTY